MAFSDANLLLVLAKLESTPDVDALPVVGSGATPADEILINEDVIPLTLDRQTNRHRFASPSHTPSKPDPGRMLWNVNIPTKLMSRGDNGGVPWLDTFLQMGGMGPPTLGPAEGTKDVWLYKPVSKDHKTGTIYAYEGGEAGGSGVLSKTTGCKGTFVQTFQPDSSPDFAFTGKGRYFKPADVGTIPTPVKPVDRKENVETINMTIGPYVPSVTRVVVTMGNELVDLRDLNKDKAYHSQHNRRRSGTMQVQLRVEDTVSNKDFFQYLEAQDAFDDATMDDIDFTHGDGVQSDIEFHGDAPYLDTLNWTPQDGIRVYDLTYILRNNIDDGEWYQKFREEQP